MFFNFVNVLLVVKYDGGVAFVSRKESMLGSLFHQGLQSSTSCLVWDCSLQGWWLSGEWQRIPFRRGGVSLHSG